SMPPIDEMMKVDLSNYVRVPHTPPAPPAEFQSPESLLPRRDPTLRFSAPYLPNTFPSSDTLRGFHLGSQIPQYRIPVPPQASAPGAGTTVNNAIVSSSSSTITNTSPLGIIQNASLNIPTLGPGQAYEGSVSLIGETWTFLTLSPTFGIRVRAYSTAA